MCFSLFLYKIHLSITCSWPKRDMLHPRSAESRYGTDPGAGCARRIRAGCRCRTRFALVGRALHPNEQVQRSGAGVRACKHPYSCVRSAKGEKRRVKARKNHQLHYSYTRITRRQQPRQTGQVLSSLLTLGAQDSHKHLWPHGWTRCVFSASRQMTHRLWCGTSGSGACAGVGLPPAVQVSM
jgi:hypothetical protein